MKDIQYFLEVEDTYNQTEPKDNMVWDEEVQDWDYKHIPLDFLRSRPFRRSFDNIEYKKELTKGFCLSDAELTILGMFIMHCSAPFRDDYYGETIPDIAMYMFEVLDNVVEKAPITETDVVYRHCKYPDKSNMKVGDILFVPHNLTCSTDLWRSHDGCVYI